jgi:hypothetical protein
MFVLVDMLKEREGERERKTEFRMKRLGNRTAAGNIGAFFL